jgi:hypothetical protein
VASFECETVFIDCDAAVVEMDSGSLRGRDAGEGGDCDGKEKDLFRMSLHAFACFCSMEGEWAWWISGGRS